MEFFLTAIQTALPLEEVDALCYKTETREIPKLVWVQGPKGRVLQKVPVSETVKCNNHEGAKAAHARLSTLLMDLLSTLPRHTTPEALERTYSEVLTPLGYWVADRYHRIEAVDKCETMKRSEKRFLTPLDELVHRSAWTILVPQLPPLLAETPLGAPMTTLLRFLNRPPFHWGDVYQDTVHVSFMLGVSPRLQELRLDMTLEEHHVRVRAWKDLAEVIRCPVSKKDLLTHVSECLWNDRFLDTLLLGLKPMPTLAGPVVGAAAFLLSEIPAAYVIRFQQSLTAQIVAAESSKTLLDLAAANEAYLECLKTLRMLIVQQSVAAAFKTLVNKDGFIEEFVKLVDATVKGLAKLGEEGNITLRRLGLLIPYITNKDTLLEHYQGRMARRLLGGSEMSAETEQEWINLFKVQIGHGTTHRLETMYKDVTKAAPTPFGSHSLRTLNMAAWPLHYLVHEQGWNVPPALQSMAEVFKASVGGQKKLTFLPGHDSVTLSATFGRKVTLTMTSLQASVLLAFDETQKEVLTAAEIEAAVGIKGPILKGVLHSLTSTKVPLLLAGSAGFSLVKTLNTPLTNIKIPSPPFVEKKADTVGEHVEQGRAFALDGAIVRVLKARKQILYQDLLAEIVKQMSHLFVPQPSAIKRRLEGLIERDYCRREEANSAMLVYVA